MSKPILIIAIMVVVATIVLLFNLSGYLWNKKYYGRDCIPIKAILPAVLASFLLVGILVFAHDYKAENDTIQAQNNANMATVLVENGVAPENVSDILNSMNEIYD